MTTKTICKDTSIDIRARGTGGDVAIECHDVMLVRADVLVLHRAERKLGAVVDGVMTDLGLLSDDVMNDIAARSHAMVEARHFDGGFVSRNIPIIKH